MNLKLVVASMSILGLVSCPVFAATTDAKPKHHHKRHHMEREREKEREVEREPVMHRDYKDMAPAPVVCTISQTAMIMDQETQSIGRSMPNPCQPGWFNRVQFSGGINLDLGKFGNRNTNYMGENYQRFSLNDAYINVGAVINEWTKAFMSIDYQTATINEVAQPDFITEVTTNPRTGARTATVTAVNSFPAEYSAAYSNNVTGGSQNALQLEQAYVTFSNFDQTPIFLQVGKQFQDFSRYEIHPITRSLTQSISETLATSAKLGFIVPLGFSGSVFVFDDPLRKNQQTSTTTNYGIALGYDQPSDNIGFDLGAAYLYNLIGVNDVAYNVNNYNLASNSYHSRAGGVALYADVNSGPFVIDARYTTAVQRFNVLDLPKNGVANPLIPVAINNGAVTAFIPSGAGSGAKPWAAGIQAAYGFEGWGRNQNIYAGYQTSREAAALNLPKNRWLVGYDVQAFGKNTNLGIEWDRDIAYGRGSGGTGHNSNLVTIRSGVEFG